MRPRSILTSKNAPKAMKTPEWDDYSTAGERASTRGQGSKGRPDGPYFKKGLAAASFAMVVVRP